MLVTLQMESMSALMKLWCPDKPISVVQISRAVTEHAVEVVAIVAMAQHTAALDAFQTAMRWPSADSMHKLLVQSVPSIPAVASMDS